MGDLSPHFDTSEFRSRDGAPLPPLWTLYHLAAHLEVLRCGNGGAPLKIISGHRSVSHNLAVGGARDSMHLTGLAADLPLGYATVRDAELAGFRGIGTKGIWVRHVDLRPTPARWTY